VSIISSTINARLEKDKERGGREFGSGMIVNFLGGGQGAGVGGGGSGMKKYIEKMGKVVEEVRVCFFSLFSSLSSLQVKLT